MNEYIFIITGDELPLIQGSAATANVSDRLVHDPEKWIPVFRKDHAQIKEIERDDDSKKRHPALAGMSI
jgi:hypothetical protein